MKFSNHIQICNTLTPGIIDNAPREEQLANTKIDSTNVAIAVTVEQIIS